MNIYLQGGSIRYGFNCLLPFEVTICDFKLGGYMGQKNDDKDTNGITESEKCFGISLLLCYFN